MNNTYLSILKDIYLFQENDKSKIRGKIRKQQNM
jgi:hypothetical protein